MVNIDRSEIAQLVRDLRAESSAYYRQWMLWLGVGSGGGIVALLSFAAALPHPDLALKSLLPGLASFVVGLSSAGISLLLAALRVGGAEAHHGAAFTRDELDEAIHKVPEVIASPPELAARMNVTRNALLRQREEHHARAESAWSWHIRWKAIHRVTVSIAALAFLFGAAWPIILVLSGQSFE